MTDSTPGYMTPPQVGKRLQVAPEKVIGWLLEGELKGSNVASKLGGRPRYRISETDLLEFLSRRSISVRPKTLGRSRRRKQLIAEMRYY